MASNGQGYDTGDLTIAVEGGELWTADMTMEMAAPTARGVLGAAENLGGMEVAALTLTGPRQSSMMWTAKYDCPGFRMSSWR